MKTITFECEDRYEAEKLASLMSVQRDGTVWIAGVGALVRNELVIRLKDRSAHAVVLVDAQVAERLQQLILDIVRDKVKVRSTDSSGAMAKIIID
jgi:hypothetical protein